MSTNDIARTLDYETRGGIKIRRYDQPSDYDRAIPPIQRALDARRGVLLTSSFEYPGRYTRWDIGFVDPPLAITARDYELAIEALNSRGVVLLEPIRQALQGDDALGAVHLEGSVLSASVAPSAAWFPEELRSKQPSVFSALRTIHALFAYEGETYLGLYGAFGYELAFQFEPMRRRLARPADKRDLVLYLPDRLDVVDHQRETAMTYLYEFDALGQSTESKPRTGTDELFRPATQVASECDHDPGEYAACVRKAIAAFGRGDLFEVVPGQTFFRPCQSPPSTLFERLKVRNPAPYGALINLGKGEYLVAASPEMYVRVEGTRIETCPISGTISRGDNAIGDAAQILKLLSSEKETSELTMCTDVDRNDKSRVCEPGSVKVIGRRQLEIYSRLIHTVDHVEGRLREGYDALDGFLAHTWAVTVTGAPKQHAMQFIEDHEKSPRAWYGGALGFIGFNGNMNTGLTLRTVRVKEGIAEVRAGATLLFESDPELEEAETRLKASALLDAVTGSERRPRASAAQSVARAGRGKKVVMIDHEDSFVHTLAGYVRETGAEVTTFRAGFSPAQLEGERPDLVLLSPGPGRPSDFGLSGTIALALNHAIPVFGVCLGLQGIVEFYGGTLRVLETPMHGKPSQVEVLGGRLFDGLPQRFAAGRYHSLYADRNSFPDALQITATASDGVIMALEHRELPVAAVQFHPESILTLEDDLGRRLIANVVATLTSTTR